MWGREALTGEGRLGHPMGKQGWFCPLHSGDLVHKRFAVHRQACSADYLSLGWAVIPQNHVLLSLFLRINIQLYSYIYTHRQTCTYERRF